MMSLDEDAKIELELLDEPEDAEEDEADRILRQKCVSDVVNRLKTFFEDANEEEVAQEEVEEEANSPIATDDDVDENALTQEQ